MMLCCGCPILAKQGWGPDRLLTHRKNRGSINVTDFALLWAQETWDILLESAPWLMGGFLLAGLLHVLVPIATISRHLGRPGWAGVLKASLVGIPLPLCSCSVIPVATSIRRQGASRGAFAGFLVSTPETGVDSIMLTYALLGPVLAVVRPVAAFVSAVTVGILVGDDKPEPQANGSALPTLQPAAASGEPSCCCSSEEPEAAAPRNRLAQAAHYGLVEMMADLSPWLFTGFLLAGLAGAAIPDGFLERNVGSGIGAMLLMLVVGLPLYVCATSSTPVAAALIARGLSPGAALVFLLAGPATNLTTMLVVSRDLGRRGLMVYITTIAVVAVAFGWLVDRGLRGWLPQITEAPQIAHDHSPTLAFPLALLFAVLLFNGLRVRIRRKGGKA